MTVESVEPEPKPRSVLAPVQTLRAIAAAMVVVAHCQDYADRSFHSGAFANLGTLGVAIFFVISGFIMYHTTRNRWTGSQQEALSFAARRLHRIVPLYWLMTSAVVLLAIVARDALSGREGEARQRQLQQALAVGIDAGVDCLDLSLDCGVALLVDPVRRIETLIGYVLLALHAGQLDADCLFLVHGRTFARARQAMLANRRSALRGEDSRCSVSSAGRFCPASPHS